MFSVPKNAYRTALFSLLIDIKNCLYLLTTSKKSIQYFNIVSIYFSRIFGEHLVYGILGKMMDETE